MPNKKSTLTPEEERIKTLEVNVRDLKLQMEEVIDALNSNATKTEENIRILNERTIIQGRYILVLKVSVSDLTSLMKQKTSARR
jgi:hypothetical protein